MTFALETSGLGRRYGKKWALEGCSLAIPEGRVVGLVGPNGAGKTTLLKIAAGLLWPTTGHVRAFGVDVAADDPPTHERVRFLAQEHPLYPSFTVAETLEMGRRLNARWDDDYARARVAELGLDPGDRIKHLSGGQRAQVSLTLAIGACVDLVLLDEPLASLDPLARRSFLEQLMTSVAERPMTVVLSSHILSDLERVTDHLVLLNHGITQVSDSVDDLLASHTVLVGPADRESALPATAEVVARRVTGRQVRLLVRRLPLVPPGWESAPSNLEEIVLAYMANAAATVMDRPVVVPTA